MNFDRFDIHQIALIQNDFQWNSDHGFCEIQACLDTCQVVPLRSEANILRDPGEHSAGDRDRDFAVLLLDRPLDVFCIRIRLLLQRIPLQRQGIVGIAGVRITEFHTCESRPLSAAQR